MKNRSRKLEVVSIGFHWFPMVSPSLYIESRRTLFFSLPSSSSFFEWFHSKLLQLSNCFASQCVLVSPLGFEPLWPLHAVQSSNIQENVRLSTHWQSFAKVNISPLTNKRLPTNSFPTRLNRIAKMLSAHTKLSNFPCQNLMKIGTTEVVLTVSLAWFLFTTSCSLFFFTTKESVFKVYISSNTASYNCLWRSNRATHLPFPGSRLECSGFFAHF